MRKDIVAVACTENEERGEAYIHIHPDYDFLYSEIIDYIEENLADRAHGESYVKLYTQSDNSKLENLVKQRGYKKLEGESFTPELSSEIR